MNWNEWSWKNAGGKITSLKESFQGTIKAQAHSKKSNTGHDLFVGLKIANKREKNIAKNVYFINKSNISGNKIENNCYDMTTHLKATKIMKKKTAQL